MKNQGNTEQQEVNEQLEAAAKQHEKDRINDEAAKQRQLVGCIVSKAALIAGLNNLQGEEVLINTQQDEVEGVGMCGMIEITDGKRVVHFFNKEFIDHIDKITEVPTKVTGEEHYTNTGRQVIWDESAAPITKKEKDGTSN